MSKLIMPSELPESQRRIIANELVIALKNRRWIKHERVYGDMADFQIYGAHTNPNTAHSNREIVERWLSFVVHGIDKIDMPTYAVIISETIYNKARDSLSKDGLLHSLDYILLNRAAAPYRVDKARGKHRVRKSATVRPISDAQDEALLRLVNYLAIRDVAVELLDRFTDDVAASESYQEVIVMAERLRQQHDL